ncbi:hypothetical protein Lal_00042059 [Lupinus albus]|nr:hypothetical protein Lal_00042059 [Lupinus albus]
METLTKEIEKVEINASEIEYVTYGGEHHLPLIMNLVDQELSEPYSIFTYRYFVYLWPQLSFLAFHKGKCVGTVVCKMGEHRNTFRGYIAMLVVINSYRGKGIATELVTRSIKMMMESGCEEDMLITRMYIRIPKTSFLAFTFLHAGAHLPINTSRWIKNRSGVTVNPRQLCSKKRDADACYTEDIVTLEAEVTNKGALALYSRLGFIRAKRLFHYYLNGVDAFRLKLLFPRLELHHLSDAPLEE